MTAVTIFSRAACSHLNPSGKENELL